MNATATETTIFDTLFAACDHIVKHYRTDFDHDRAWLAENHGMPFLHFARNTGTHLFGLSPAERYPAKGERVPYLFSTADREHILKGTVDCVRYCVENEVTELCHYFDGKRLRRIDIKQAMRIANDYASAIRHAWSKER